MELLYLCGSIKLKKSNLLKTVIIDNYDSFTYNLVHYIEAINGERPAVYRNDTSNLNEIKDFDCIVLSPGPGLPENAGLMMQVIEEFYTSKIILGICLGHQALGQFFGGELLNLSKVFHGVSSPIYQLNDDVLYRDLRDLIVGRYHSWVVQSNQLPECLISTSVDKDGNVMSLKHTSLPIHGIQYHPESVMTPQGKKILQNFFESYKS